MDHTPQADRERKPYETPRIHSSDSFERLALACTGQGNVGPNTRNFPCAANIKPPNPSGNCDSCTAGS